MNVQIGILIRVVKTSMTEEGWCWKMNVQIGKYMQCMFTLNKNNHNLCSDNKILLLKCHTTNVGLKSFIY